MPSVVNHVLKFNDAAWLYAESHRTPMHFGLLATFSMPHDADDRYLEDLVNRWREVRTFQPPFNYRLQMFPVPRWEQLADEHIDLDYHFRHSAVPSPGGERELGVLVSRLQSQQLDRRYPLWECHVIEGLAEGTWSMYLKVHHSQVDGVGGVRLARRMFPVDPASRDVLPLWAVGTSGPDQSGRSLEPRREDVEPADGQGRDAGIRSVVSALRSLTKTYAETLTGARESERAVPFRSPRSVLNTRIQAPRRFATQIYDIARLKRVAEAVDSSLNDVFLAICGGALRAYLAELGDLPPVSLTANVPVSVRQEGEAGVGNAITFLYAKLGTDIEDPVERLHTIRESTRLGKARLPVATGAVMDGFTTLLMFPFLGQAVLGVGGYGPPAMNVVISNVPGFQEQRYLEGSKLEGFYPLGLLFHGQALNITAASNADSFCIGYTGCRNTLPHLQRVAVHSGEALEELEAALGLACPG